MGLIDRLHSITGLRELQELKPTIRQGLITSDSQRHDQISLNSGSLRGISSPQEGMSINPLLDPKEGDRVRDYFGPGERMNPTMLYLPPNSLRGAAHFHPGGELTYVIEGEYFDADLQGNPIRTYPQGETVIYTPFSTHNPLSEKGALLLYVPFDGLVFGKDAEALLEKMGKMGAPQSARKYAQLWAAQTE